MRNWLFIILGSFSLITACKKDDTLSSSKGISSFRLEAEKNSHKFLQDVFCDINGNEIRGALPYGVNPSTLVATFNNFGKRVSVNGKSQQSGVTKNDFSKPVIYEVEAHDGSIKEYTVTIYKFTGLPIVKINTENNAPIDSKDEYVNAQLTIDPNASVLQGYNGNIQIKGRGNSTWKMPKRPYKIKLSTKSEILGMPADKEWVLLANYSDKTLMRNYLAFESSKRIGLPYTPRSQFVELFLNDKYVGNYQLTEQIKIAPERVSIPELDKDDNAENLITGGYLLEIEQRLEENDDPFFKTAMNIPFFIKSPSDITATQMNYIQNYVQQVENVLYSSDFADLGLGYEQYINTETFLKWYWINELFKINDAAFYSSVYMYKDRDAKLCAGPVWDFDTGAGNINFNNNHIPQGWWVKSAPWISRLFQDPAFQQKAKLQWQILKDNLISVNSFIDATTKHLQYSQEQNFKRWKILSKYVWPNAFALGSYEAEVDYLKNWLQARISWIDAQL